MDAGGTLALPALPNGECYVTRGLWVSRDDTKIVSNGACIVGLGPGEVRIRSTDGDPIGAEAIFYISRTSPWDPAPVRISISSVKLHVPDGVELYGIAVMAHQVAIHGVEVSGSPKDALIISGRANDGFAARVSVVDSRFLGARRNVISVTGGIDIRLVGNEIRGASDTYPVGNGRSWGNPAAGIDVEPDGRGLPILGLRIAENVIEANAGPGILLALSTNHGLPVIGSQIDIVGNRIVSNGTKSTPPQHGGIVFNGGQDSGGGRVLVERNVIRGNRGGALVGRADVTVAIEQRDNQFDGAFSIERLKTTR